MKQFENVKIETLNRAYKPFDVVTNSSGNVGFIQEVSINDCQPDKLHQISYAVKWLVYNGGSEKAAWFTCDELTVHSNIFVSIAECACHPMGGNSVHVNTLFKSMGN